MGLLHRKTDDLAVIAEENNAADNSTKMKKSRIFSASANTTPRQFSAGALKFLTYCENGLNTFESFFNVIVESLCSGIAAGEAVGKKRRILRALLAFMMIFPFAVSLFHQIAPAAARTFRAVRRAITEGRVPRFLLAHAGPITVFILAIGVITTISTVASYDIQIAAYVNGKEIGYVYSRDTVANAKAEVESYMTEATGTAYNLTDSITYKFKLAKSNQTELLNTKNVYELLYAKASESYTDAYGLYIDGTFIAANESRVVLEDSMTQIYADIAGQSDGEIRLLNNISIEQRLYPKTSLKDAETVYALIAKGASISGVTLPDEEILQIYEEDETKYYAPNLNTDAQVGLPAADAAAPADNTAAAPIIYQTVMTEITTEPYAYDTEYVPDNTMYIGTEKLKTVGVPGEKTIVYEVVYEDGREISRVVIDEYISVEPVNEVYYAGTKEIPKTASKGYYTWPLKTYTAVTDSFGWRTVNGRSSYHTALDIAAPKGTAVYAADGGKVIEVNTNTSKSKGIYIYIQHDNGEITSYCHLSAVEVELGERVYQGQKIGEVGSTGYATGNHLHFEICVDGVYRNPLDYLPNR